MAETSPGMSASSVRAAHEIRVVVGRLRRRLRETYDMEGLTPTQTSVLSRLSKDGPASASGLAAAERVRPQSIALTLGVLDERGLIDRRPDPDDGRRQVISVSEAGHAFIEDNRRAGEEWLARSLETGFTEDERQAIISSLALLDRLNDA
ncbi:MarR family winged helix-turn-helix transcriptional regulator [Streptomyces sp. NPDC021098]|uniref:MarR family winged helix-turn-helix transcriptional regulator n=1 Tax=unclassified Streptomyces TaxID=2593676 RepID=UPI003797A7F3